MATIKKLVLLLKAIVVCGLVFGCAAPKPPVPAEQLALAPEVVTIDIGWPFSENWDADPEVDGLLFCLMPKDPQDEMVSSPGTLSAKLWLQKSIVESEKGKLIQIWSNIPVSKDDYGFLGVRLCLEYGGFTPTENQWGILEVTFNTIDGGSFTARAKDIYLGE